MAETIDISKKQVLYRLEQLKFMYEEGEVHKALNYAIELVKKDISKEEQ